MASTGSGQANLEVGVVSQETCSLLFDFLQGELEEEEEEGEEGVALGRKASYGSRSGSKIRRKGTVNHIRGSVHSNRGSRIPREKSQTALPTSSAPAQYPMKDGGDQQMEMVTVHQ